MGTNGTARLVGQGVTSLPKKGIKEKHVVRPATIKLLKKKKKDQQRTKFPRKFMLWEEKAKEEIAEFRRH